MAKAAKAAIAAKALHTAIFKSATAIKSVCRVKRAHAGKYLLVCAVLA